LYNDALEFPNTNKTQEIRARGARYLSITADGLSPFDSRHHHSIHQWDHHDSGFPKDSQDM
jgi:hypothetical protein